MQTLRRRLRPLAWLALVAMLGLGLLPSVSHALAWAGGSSHWAGVCSASGQARAIAGELPAGQGGVPVAGTFEHCPYCAHAAGYLGLPPASSTRTAPQADAVASGGARLVPPASAAWTAAQPRAPPTLT